MSIRVAISKPRRRNDIIAALRVRLPGDAEELTSWRECFKYASFIEKSEVLVDYFERGLLRQRVAFNHSEPEDLNLVLGAIIWNLYASKKEELEQSMNCFGCSAEAEGKRILAIETNSATFYFAFFEACAKVASHAHGHPSIIYAVGGPCTENAEDGKTVVGKLTYRPSGFEHSLTFEGPTHLFSIEITNWSDPSCAWPDKECFLPATLYDSLWRAFIWIPECDRVRMNGAFLTFFRKSLEFLKLRPPEWLGNVVEHIHSEWRSVPSVSGLSDQFSISPQHLSHTFKRFLGATIQQYGVMLRLDHARNLLWGTDMSIAKIAAETGFADQSHLTRALKASLENTPLRFRTSGPATTYDTVRDLSADARLAFVYDRMSFGRKAV